MLVLVASACTPAPPDDASSPSEPATSAAGATTLSGEQGVAGSSPGGISEGVPPLSVLVATQPIVAPGDTITLTGPSALSGSLLLIGPGGDEVTGVFNNGTGSVDLPARAPEGEWRAMVTGDTAAMAVGVVEVASGPSLLLVSDRNRVTAGDAVTVTLYSAGLPDDTGILFGWGDLDWGAYFADEEADGEEPLGVLVPDDNGLLQVGSQPVALGDIVGVPLVMSGMEMAGLQAMAFSITDTEVYLSNPLSLEACNTSSDVRGELGGPGVVHLISHGDGLRSAAAVSSGGTFSFDAPHGPTTLFAARDDGSVLDPVTIELPCGATADVDMVSGTVEIGAGPIVQEAGRDGGEAAVMDGGTVTLSGDLSVTFDVEPVCQYRRDSVGVIFATYDEDLPAVQLEIPAGDTSGSHQGTVEVTDWLSTTRSSSGAATVSIAYAPGVGLAEAQMSVTGEFAGPSGNGTIEASFGCIVTGVTPPAPDTTATESESVTTAEGVPTEPQPTSFDTPGPDSTTVAAACRTIIVDDVGDSPGGVRAAAALRTRLGRATVVTLSEMRTVFDTGELPQVVSAVGATTPDIIVRIDDAQQVVAAALVGPNTQNRGEDWAVAGPLDDVVDALAGRVQCVDVDPIDVASGASEDIVVRATDLTGTPITEATVTIGDPEFGTVATEGEQLVDGVFRATYTGGAVAGEDILTVEVGGGEYWSTTVLASIATGFGYIMEGQYRVELNPVADDVPAPGGPLSATLVAGSCTGRNGPWDGLLVLEAGPILTMIAIGGAAGEIGEGVFGTPTDSGEDPSILLPDIGLAMVTSMGMPIDVAVLAPVAAEILTGIDDPYRPIVLATTFRLPPTGYTSLIIATDASGYSLAVRPNRRDVVELTAGGTHLLNAVIKRGSCPSDSDVADLARELVPKIEG